MWRSNRHQWRRQEASLRNDALALTGVRFGVGEIPLMLAMLTMDPLRGDAARLGSEQCKRCEVS